ncbi:MAG: RrF2 family transcriptional regulator [Thermoanaerobaculia bacterium]
MRVGEGVEWGLHCCAILTGLPSDGSLSASRLAEYHGVPGAYLAKHLQALAQAGVIQSSPGRTGGYRLARPASEISILDVVEAIEGAEPHFRCAEIRRRGAARHLPAAAFPSRCGIAHAMERAEAAWRRELSRQTIQDLVRHFLRGTDPRVRACARDWIAGVLRPGTPRKTTITRRQEQR